MRQIVRPERGHGGVERGREGGAANAGAQESVMAGLVCEDRAGGGEEGGGVGEHGGAAEVGADTDRGDHVGKVHELRRAAVGETVGACGEGALAAGGEDGGEGVAVGCFLLLMGGWVSFALRFDCLPSTR